VGLPHGLDDAEVLDERRSRKIDIDSLRVLSPRIRRVHHVAVEPMSPRVRSSRNGCGVHHGESWIYRVVIGENDPGPGKDEVIRHVLRSYVVRSESVGNKEERFACSGPYVLLWLCLTR